MNELGDIDGVFTFPNSNQFFVLQNVSKKLDVDSSVPVLLLDENQSGLVNNFLCTNSLPEDVDALFSSDSLGNDLLRFDKEKTFNSFMGSDCDDIETFTQIQKEIATESDIDIEGISDEEISQTPKSEETIYLCSKCSNPFSSIEKCKEHMIKDHNLRILLNDLTENDHMSVETEQPEVPTIQNTQTDEEPPSDIINTAPSLVNSNTTETNESIESNSNEDEERPEVQEAEKQRAEVQESFKDPDFIVKAFRCDFLGCCIKFSSNKSCVMHQDCHEVNSKMYICSQKNCDKKFDTWKKCVLHLWKEHKIDIDLYTCPVCKVYKTTSTFFLKCHSRIHLEEKRFSCTECDKKFKQKSQLVNHVASVHTKKSLKKTKNENPDDSEKWYTKKVCEICFKTYADSKCLKKHIQTVHRKMKPYVCNICGHKSAKKGMMQIHIRSHTGEKPYACDFEGCSYKTGDHNSLRRHRMTHTGVRPYRCAYCPFASIQATAFKKHIIAKHKDMKDGAFMCNLCSFGTINPTLYLNHMSDHKHGLIQEEEVFVENVAAANLVCESLGVSSQNHSQLKPTMTGSSTYAGGKAQTITLEIPNGDLLNTDDEDTVNCFPNDDGIVTGGITIPAGLDQEALITLPPNCVSEFEVSSLIEGSSTL